MVNMEQIEAGRMVTTSSWGIGWSQSLKIWIALNTILVNISGGRKNTSWTAAAFGPSHEWMSILWEEAFVRTICYFTYNRAQGLIFHVCFSFPNSVGCNTSPGKTSGYFFLHCRLFKNKPPASDDNEDDAQSGVNKASRGGIIYGDYLQVESTRRASLSVPGVLN